MNLYKIKFNLDKGANNFGEVSDNVAYIVAKNFADAESVYYSNNIGAIMSIELLEGPVYVQEKIIPFNKE